jgi:hypothetical protein
VKRIIATHKDPDADALAAAWLASRYLFDGDSIEVIFLPRNVSLTKTSPLDCVVDLCCTYDRERLIFDHKPPAFADRNETCATRLVWDHLRACGKPLNHLAALIGVVHEGDSRPPRQPSAALKESRRDGFHAAVRWARENIEGDREVFLAASKWLNKFERVARRDGR